MQKRPFLYIGLTCFLTVFAVTLLPPVIGVVAIALAAIGLVAAGVFVPQWQRYKGIAAAMAIAAVLCGTGCTVYEKIVIQPQLALSGTTLDMTVRVQEALPSQNAYIVCVEEGDIPKGTRLCFWMGYRQIAPKNGDLIKSRAELTAAYDDHIENGCYAKANGVYLYAWPTKDATVQWIDGQDSLPFFTKALYRLRERLHDTLYQHLSFEAAALSEGMMLGNRTNLSYKTADAFRASGVYHILAVSGLHISIVTGAVLALCKRLGCSRRVRSWVAMFTAVLFMALCGFTPSVVRAGIMMIVVLGSDVFRRRGDGLNSLGFAATAMIAFDLFCVFDIGWQLSFAAVLGLFLWFPIWQKEVTNRLKQHLNKGTSLAATVSSAVGVSLCATLMTLPLTTLYFKNVSTVTVLGNILCITASSVLLVVNFAAVLTACIPIISSLLFGVSEWLCGYLSVCTDCLS